MDAKINALKAEIKEIEDEINQLPLAVQEELRLFCRIAVDPKLRARALAVEVDLLTETG